MSFYFYQSIFFLYQNVSIFATSASRVPCRFPQSDQWGPDLAALSLPAWA